MYHYNGARWYKQFLGQWIGSGFDLAWFSSLSSEHLCISSLYGTIYIVNFLLHSLPFSELSLPFNGPLLCGFTCNTQET